MKSEFQRYTKTAIAFHWLVALLILVTFPLGMYMQALPLSPDKLKLYSWHKWVGITILVLAFLRFFWRLSHAPPIVAETMTRWQRFASHAVHVLLYLLIFVVPLSGWVMSSAKGFQTIWFGVLPLPDLVSKDKAVADFLTSTHKNLNYTLLALVVLHVAATVKHHFIDHDATLRRILPYGKEGRS